MATFRYLKNIFLETIFPRDGYCLFCHKLLLFERGPFCYPCVEKIPWIGEKRCVKCGKEEGNADTGLCHDCTFYEQDFKQGISLFTYIFGGKKIIQEIKYEGNIKLARWVGREMAKQIGTMPWQDNIDFIIPVPLHPNRLKERGFNQAEELARGIISIVDIKLLKNGLMRTKDTPHQTDLTKWERQKNIAGVFKVSDEQLLKGKTLLLIDDVYTTGATINACAKVLKTAGAGEVYFATAAGGRQIE
ncbi:ComF family protein [Irregularibacter muris]|uniref:ComF family protein n=1 Tax=Irregularibacter muris TaxID=1796619 RepID=A0AAE3HEW8_9FIRM|nr:ComF family protein [Irregularibacter muris]MCR1898235.1 ComF family protein [Irregularibacter muris]